MWHFELGEAFAILRRGKRKLGMLRDSLCLPIQHIYRRHSRDGV